MLGTLEGRARIEREDNIRSAGRDLEVYPNQKKSCVFVEGRGRPATCDAGSERGRKATPPPLDW